MPARPWERRPAETEPAYDAFLKYRDLGSDRSFEALRQKHGDTTAKTRTIEGWSSKHDWVARCTAWDNHLQRERDKIAVLEARKWEKRRQQALEVNWDTAQAIRAKLDKMMAWPIQRQETSKDGKTIIIEPARWSFQTVALLAKTAAELEAATLLAVGGDPDTMSDAEARATAEESGEGEDQAGRR